MKLSADSPLQVTQLLLRWSQGDRRALDELTPLLYQELRQLARGYMSRENHSHTLQATALVNEAYLRLIEQNQVQWQNRAHFFAIAAQMMRRILVDHARRANYAKRGGGAVRVSLAEGFKVAQEEQTAEVLALDEALQRLSEIDPRRGRVVEMRYFGGLDNEEIAHALDISPNTVMRDWNLAKAWLRQQIVAP